MRSKNPPMPPAPFQVVRTRTVVVPASAGWTVHPADGASSTVRVRTAWNGAGGIGGFFERTFAPRGLRRVYEDLLGRLDRELAAG